MPFGQLAGVISTLEAGGFRLVGLEAGATILSFGESVSVTVTPDANDPLQFTAVELKIEPLSAYQEEPGVRPAIELVLSLFESWAPGSRQRTQATLSEAARTQTSTTETEQTSSDTFGEFRLDIAASYGGQSASDDFFIATLRRGP